MTEQTSNTEPTSASAKKLHATREEANAAKPADAPKRIKLFEVIRNGQSLGFVWTDGHAGAVVIAAREAGYTATLADKKGGGFFSKEMIASRLGAFTDEELAEMGLVRGSKQERKSGKK
jgi:hypothetical protein